MAVAVLRSGVPRWAAVRRRVLGGLDQRLPPLAVLPYGGGRERNFDFLQQLVANLGPLLGVVLVAGLACQLVVSTRSRVPATRP